MSTTRRDPHPSTGAEGRGTAVLVAAALPPGGRAVPGELVWFPEPCRDPLCDCDRRFSGASSGAPVVIAAVRRLEGTSRGEATRALVAAMTGAGHDIVCARTRAAMLLRLAESLPDGTLLDVGDGRPKAFPPGTRVVGGDLLEIRIPIRWDPR